MKLERYVPPGRVPWRSVREGATGGPVACMIVSALEANDRAGATGSLNRRRSRARPPLRSRPCLPGWARIVTGRTPGGADDGGDCGDRPDPGGHRGPRRYSPLIAARRAPRAWTLVRDRDERHGAPAPPTGRRAGFRSAARSAGSGLAPPPALDPTFRGPEMVSARRLDRWTCGNVSSSGPDRELMEGGGVGCRSSPNCTAPPIRSPGLRVS